MSAELLRARVEERLIETGKNATAAALAVGLGESFIRDILRGRKTSVQGRNLEKLAQALECEPGFLLGIIDRPTTADDHLLPIFMLGNVGAGVWLDKRVLRQQQSENTQSAVPPDPRFNHDAQFDLIVSGDSMDQFAREGQRLRCVKLEHYTYDVVEHDVLIVERERGDLLERFALRVTARPNGKMELAGLSASALWRKETFGLVDGRLQESSEISVVGIVLYLYDEPRRGKLRWGWGSVPDLNRNFSRK